MKIVTLFYFFVCEGIIAFSMLDLTVCLLLVIICFFFIFSSSSFLIIILFTCYFFFTSPFRSCTSSVSFDSIFFFLFFIISLFSLVRKNRWNVVKLLSCKCQSGRVCQVGSVRSDRVSSGWVRSVGSGRSSWSGRLAAHRQPRHKRGNREKDLLPLRSRLIS